MKQLVVTIGCLMIAGGLCAQQSPLLQEAYDFWNEGMLEENYNNEAEAWPAVEPNSTFTRQYSFKPGHEYVLVVFTSRCNYCDIKLKAVKGRKSEELPLEPQYGDLAFAGYRFYTGDNKYKKVELQLSLGDSPDNRSHETLFLIYSLKATEPPTDPEVHPPLFE